MGGGLKPPASAGSFKRLVFRTAIKRNLPRMNAGISISLHVKNRRLKAAACAGFPEPTTCGDFQSQIQPAWAGRFDAGIYRYGTSSAHSSHRL